MNKKALIIHSASTALNQGLIYLHEKYDTPIIDLLIGSEHNHLDFHMVSGEVFSLNTTHFQLSEKNDPILNKLRNTDYSEVIILTRGKGIWSTNYSNVEKLARSLNCQQIEVIDHTMNTHSLNTRLKIKRNMRKIKNFFSNYGGWLRLYFWKLPLFLLLGDKY